ncbi:unnamed protein product [Oppiella nova]|uniref:Cytochrome P450 n=1 Tax=Oppiella nova TaxID=334625 RepID=A0A7R9M1I4_9ACAR|nr:unnamed protein product [Oppiella nova]CAG2168445.1 unnamed protein product [Oppiella nova]
MHSTSRIPRPLFPKDFLPANRHKLIDYTYVPFGSGPRHCVGMRFALLEAKLCLTHIIKNYRLVTTVRTDIPVSLGTHIYHTPRRVIVGVEPENKLFSSV